MHTLMKLWVMSNIVTQRAAEVVFSATSERENPNFKPLKAWRKKRMIWTMQKTTQNLIMIISSLVSCTLWKAPAGKSVQTFIYTLQRGCSFVHPQKKKLRSIWDTYGLTATFQCDGGSLLQLSLSAIRITLQADIHIISRYSNFQLKHSCSVVVVTSPDLLQSFVVFVFRTSGFILRSDSLTGYK